MLQKPALIVHFMFLQTLTSGRLLRYSVMRKFLCVYLKSWSQVPYNGCASHTDSSFLDEGVLRLMSLSLAQVLPVRLQVPPGDGQQQLAAARGWPHHVHQQGPVLRHHTRVRARSWQAAQEPNRQGETYNRIRRIADILGLKSQWNYRC